MLVTIIGGAMLVGRQALRLGCKANVAQDLPDPQQNGTSLKPTDLPIQPGTQLTMTRSRQQLHFLTQLPPESALSQQETSQAIKLCV